MPLSPHSSTLASLAATSGVHSGVEVVKVLLAGVWLVVGGIPGAVLIYFFRSDGVRTAARY